MISSDEQNISTFDDLLSLKGIVFNIQRYSTQDGPGIRTCVFLKGCPLRCAWCSNPESQVTSPEIVIDPALCRNCGSCERVCPVSAIFPATGSRRTDNSKCTLCSACIDVCPANAIRLYGRLLKVSEVLDTVLRDKSYYLRSGGGLTVSGGEPALQWEFTNALTRAAKAEGIGTLVETCGHAPWEYLEKALEFADMVFYDLKLADDILHRYYTGQGNGLILENLHKVSLYKERLTVRIPLIPGINDSEKELSAIGEIIKSLPHVERIGILPYHRFGVKKYILFDRKYGFEDTSPPDERTISYARDLLEKITGYEVLVGI